MIVTHEHPVGWVDTDEPGLVQPSQVSGLVHVVTLEAGDLLQGPQGVPGVDGAPGPQGLPGVDGEQGPQGLPGADGAQGLRGLPGADGAQGPQGLPGADGAQGPQGLPGADGAQGLRGLPGADGAQGLRGLPGADGARGPQGLPGADGAQGLQGLPGADGAQGPQGVPGSADWPAGVSSVEVGYLAGLVGGVQDQINSVLPRSVLGHSVNLNTLTTGGVFIQQKNAKAASGVNYPVALAGLLEVFVLSVDMISQRYTVYGSGRVFVRGVYMSSWSAWVELAPVVHSHVLLAGDVGSYALLKSVAAIAAGASVTSTGANLLYVTNAGVSKGAPGAGQVWRSMVPFPLLANDCVMFQRVS